MPFTSAPLCKLEGEAATAAGLDWRDTWVAGDEDADVEDEENLYDWYTFYESHSV